MSRTENQLMAIQLINRYFHALATFDWGALLAMLAPTVEYHEGEAAVVKGSDRVIDRMKVSAHLWFSPVAVTSSQNGRNVTCKFLCRERKPLSLKAGKFSGDIAAQRAAFFDLHDGLIAKISEYSDARTRRIGVSLSEMENIVVALPIRG